MPRTKRVPTIHDVAAAAGVSVTTVSRVLNNKDDVAPETFQRVLDVIHELGYASSLAARSMRSRRTRMIGLITPNMDYPFAIEVIKGVSRAVTDAGYDLIACTSAYKTESTVERWEQQQVARLNGTITDGLIVVVPRAHVFRTAFPLVAVDPHHRDTSYPAVVADNYAGARAAMEHLLGLGHLRIGYIGGRAGLQSARRRQKGYEDALCEAELPIDPDLIMEGDYTYESGRECARQLLTLAQPPTAIFAANDESAFGAMDAARAMGLRIPDDISIVGFDNIPESASTVPPLTTVDQTIRVMGREAVRILIDLIENRPLETNLVQVPTSLVVRSSARRIR